eukprot:2204311-Pyramimonas_sp.AAC.1
MCSRLEVARVVVHLPLESWQWDGAISPMNFSWARGSVNFARPVGQVGNDWVVALVVLEGIEVVKGLYVLDGRRLPASKVNVVDSLLDVVSHVSMTGPMRLDDGARGEAAALLQ